MTLDFGRRPTTGDSPFLIKGPALISFSGGRTSGYMLWRILQAHGGALPDDVIPVFANTGKEAPETLAFVDECAENWWPIRWIEWRDGENGHRWREVDYYDASKNGEPFAALIAKKKYLPNGVTRFCTSELKIRPMRDFARSLGWDHWDVVIGLRADEPRRVAKLKAHNDGGKERFDRLAPLAEAGITNDDVLTFWRSSNFDLQLPSVGGKTLGGNCDLCMLKATSTLVGLIREQPERANWWIEQERVTGGTFRKPNRPMPSYRDLRAIAALPLDPDLFDTAELSECHCHD